MFTIVLVAFALFLVWFILLTFYTAALFGTKDIELYVVGGVIACFLLLCDLYFLYEEVFQ